MNKIVLAVAEDFIRDYTNEPDDVIKINKDDLLCVAKELVKINKILRDLSKINKILRNL